MSPRLTFSGWALLVAGCAGSGGVPVSDAPVSASASAAAPAYQLTAEEQALDCKKLTGKMQVRILQERDYVYRRQSSSTSQTLQTAARTVLGGSTHGMDPEADHRSTVAQLEAYNARLAEKGCKTFDLSKELEPKPVTVTPVPVNKPDAEKTKGAKTKS